MGSALHSCIPPPPQHASACCMCSATPAVEQEALFASTLAAATACSPAAPCPQVAVSQQQLTEEVLELRSRLVMAQQEAHKRASDSQDAGQQLQVGGDACTHLKSWLWGADGADRQIVQTGRQAGRHQHHIVQAVYRECIDTMLALSAVGHTCS